VDAQPTTFDGEIAKFKNWISTRLTWLDANMPGRDIQGTDVQGTGTMSEEFSLLQNYPNPFNPSTNISYLLKNNGKVRLSVYDILGREVAVLANEIQTAGAHEVIFSANGLSSGVYFYRINAGTFTQSKQMMLIK
jgi:hypothetical protein